MLRSTIPPKHSRVCSSMIDTILTGRPSVVESNWKSTAHTRLGASAVTAGGAVEVPWCLRLRRYQRDREVNFGGQFPTGWVSHPHR